MCPCKQSDLGAGYRGTRVVERSVVGERERGERRPNLAKLRRQLENVLAAASSPHPLPHTQQQ